jgi:hypothetical protein
METLLDVGAFAVFAIIVVCIPRAVYRGNPGPHAGVLAGFVALALTVFGLVSMSVASGLAAGSSLVRVILLTAFVLVAILCRITWSSATTAR